MTHIIVQQDGETLKIPEATIGQLISMTEEQYRQDREMLLADLNAVNASDESKLAALEDLRYERGLTAKMARKAFTLDGAVEILKVVAEPNDVKKLLQSDKDELTYLVLRVLGFQQREEEEQETESASERP